MITSAIPPGALAIFYKAGRKEGTYYLWSKLVRQADGDFAQVWYWQALGNCGTSDNAMDATDDAKRWIRDSR